MKKILIALILLMMNFNLSYSQDDELTYKIFSDFPVGVFHTYDFTENTSVLRTYSDSSQVNYDKFLIYHLSMRAPNEPDNGFLILEVSIDSLKYKFSDSRDTVEYNSQSDEVAPPFQIPDYVKSSVILGKEFEFEYNPYYEVIKVAGDRLERQRYRIKDPNKGMRDSLRRYIWLKQLSDEHLEFVSDLRKGLFPDFRAKEDTTWKTRVYLESEGIRFYDSVEVKFNGYEARSYLLTGESFDLELIDEDAVIHKIEAKSSPQEIKGNIEYELRVNPRGFIEYLQIDMDLKFEMKIKNETFNQHVVSTYTWELGKMYKW